MIDLANRLKEANASVETMSTQLCQLKLEKRELERRLALEIERKNTFASMIRSDLVRRSHHHTQKF
jgi:predicted transcriptional regulator